MQLTKIVDPRDNLGRASRDELWDFAKANGVAFDQRTATKQYMEKELRDRGLTNIRVAVRFQGAPTGDYFPADGSAVTIEQPKIREVDADADMTRQMKEQAAKSNDWPVESTVKKDGFPIRLGLLGHLSINELRAECKSRGIKLDRRDNMKSMREKLSSVMWEDK
jgi:hypothetical protein